MTAFNIFLILIVAVCLLLALVIMVQNPKGGGLSSSFGGNTQVVGGVKKTGDFLERSTWTFATLLAALILVANTLLQSNTGAGSGSRLLDGAPIENNILNTPNPASEEQPATSSNTAQ